VGLALASADRLLCLKDGSVYASGTAQELAESGCLPGLYGVEMETLDTEYGPELAGYLRQSFGISRQAEKK
jgi:ABC-type cobalamin/Fe3+-siderophores transport system ATPase subunit